MDPSRRCGFQAGSDDTPCSFDPGHARPHRVRSPYFDGRWIDYVEPPGRGVVEVARDVRFGPELGRRTGETLYARARLVYDSDREALAKLAGPGQPVGLTYGVVLLEPAAAGPSSRRAEPTGAVWS